MRTTYRIDPALESFQNLLGLTRTKLIIIVTGSIGVSPVYSSAASLVTDSLLPTANKHLLTCMSSLGLLQLPQLSNISYCQSSCGTSLYLILVGCFLLAGNTLLIYRSPTLIFSYFFPSSPIQPFNTSKSISGSIVRKKGSEYRSCPVLFRTR